MRITSQMMTSRYKRDVTDAFSSMNKAMTRAYDYRAFEKPSEDPLAAAQTFEVHWEMDQNADYSSNVQNLQGFSSTGSTVLENVYKVLSDSSSSSIQTILKGIDGGSNTGDRTTSAAQLRSFRDSIMEKMNAKYGDSYIFGGSNSDSAPFQMINNQLYYRNINVDTGENLNGASVQLNYLYKKNPADPTEAGTSETMQVNFGKDLGKTLNTYKIQLNSTASGTNLGTSVSGKTITINIPVGTTKDDLQKYFQGDTTKSGGTSFAQALTTGGVPNFTNTTSTKGVTISGLPDNKGDTISLPASGTTSSAITDIVDLKALANENVYVDIGLGITTTNGKIDDQSAFDSSMAGLAYLGYGTTTITNSDGSTSNVPNNICSLLTKIADCMANDTSNTNTALQKAVSPYRDNLKTAMSTFIAGQTKQGQQAKFLSDTSDYLSDMKLNLADKDNQVEYVNVYEAIEDFYNQQYCYNASLKVGSQVLQQSLMDYLK